MLVWNLPFTKPKAKQLELVVSYFPQPKSI